MTIKPGHVFGQALEAIDADLGAAEKKTIAQNAIEILEKAVNSTTSDKGAGLIYGKIQSGKTMAMITTGALALDNGFRIIVILTSHMNPLAEQTRDDFQKGLPGALVYFKTDLKKTLVQNEIEHATNMLSRPNGGIVIVTSKGKAPLQNTITFLKQINATNHRALIFDDEGDQATLDNNTNRRAAGDPNLQPTTVHGLIHVSDPNIESIRGALPKHLFLSVTGTPQGLVLQSINSASRPSFISLLEPGRGYVGGNVFFASTDPSSKHYIESLDPQEGFKLRDTKIIYMPEGLKDAICFFILAATAAGLKLGWKQYKLLCHPGLEKKHHEKVLHHIADYIEEVTAALYKPEATNSKFVMRRMVAQYAILAAQTDVPPLKKLLTDALKFIDSRKMVLINSTTTNQRITYSPQYNFLVGGNSIGRGLAIKKLLVTYYVREAKKTQMDTMYQHARMFGYRMDTLPYTRVFMPPQLYERFHLIYESDEKLRQIIRDHKDDAVTYLVQTRADIPPTRKSVLDTNRITMLLPGQLYPDYPIYKKPKAEKMLKQTLSKLLKVFPDYESRGSQGIEVDIEDALSILRPIRTEARNSWRDKHIAAALRNAAAASKNRLMLKFREAPGRNPDGDFPGRITGGILGDEVWKAEKAAKMPTLWIFRVARDTKDAWDGVEFVYPSIVFPDSMPPFVFNHS